MRHNRTQKHRSGACECFGHKKCDPKKCRLANISTPGYVAWYEHADIVSGKVVIDEKGEIDKVDGKKI